MLRHNGKIIARKVVRCDNLFLKGSGLMFRSRHSVDDTAWHFPFKKSRNVGITMFFVFFPIDILFLDKHNRIIELKQDVRPFQNYVSKSKITSFIELKQGTINRNSLKKGDVLSFS